MPSSASEPRPRAHPIALPEISWPVRARLAVPWLDPPDVPFALVLHSRRSRRCLCPAPLKQTLGWLNFTSAPAYVSEHSGIERLRAPALSAGALSSVIPLLLSGRGSARLFRPRPLDFGAEALAVGNLDPLFRLRANATTLLPGTSGCDLIALLCDFQCLAAVYEDAESLAWRDAGAMLQTLALTATALGLGFCPLGLLGGEVTEALDIGDRLRGVGVAVVGLSNTQDDIARETAHIVPH